jgi:3-oxo-5alpha-steroid 4-dehydrogenase
MDPYRVKSCDHVEWDDSADLVVVGFGGAGVVTSIQARELNMSVIAIDRFDGGGATAFSGGVVYAGGTRYLQQSGYDDNAEEMYLYLVAEKSAVNAATLRRFCEGSRDDIDWLDRQGVPHGTHVFEEKTAFPPDNYFLYYSGNEKMPAFAAVAKPAPRGHRTAVNGFAGHVYFNRLRESALAKGVRLMPHAPVTRLVTDASDRVIGVEINPLPPSVRARHQALYQKVQPWMPFIGKRIERAIEEAVALEATSKERRLIRADRGVVLATGAFSITRRWCVPIARSCARSTRICCAWARWATTAAVYGWANQSAECSVMRRMLQSAELWYLPIALPTAGSSTDRVGASSTRRPTDSMSATPLQNSRAVRPG